MKKILTFMIIMIMALSICSVSYAAVNEGDTTPAYEEEMKGAAEHDGYETSNETPLTPAQGGISGGEDPFGIVLTAKWKVESVKCVNDAYNGAWKTLDSVVISKNDAPQDIKVSATTTFSNTVKGDCNVTRDELSAGVGFSVTQTYKKSLSITKKNAGAGTWYFKSRPVMKEYKVVQRLYKIGAGTPQKTNTTATVYVYKFDHAAKTLTQQK